MLRRFYIFALSFVVLSSMAGCAPTTPYFPSNSILPTPEFDLAYVEFGEQGSYQAPEQLERLTDLIQKTRRPLVVTFVHGWQNNAKSGDVESFKGLLRSLSKSQIVRDNHYRVIGVFLGWRGQLTKVPVVKEFTFWSRKAAAERLASNFDCYDTIASVTEATRRHPEGQYTILIGHSFGGLIVERSVAHAINAEIHGTADPGKALPADLILLLNPASDSILTRQMMAALNARRLANTRQFIVSLTSTTDSATGTDFPLATGLSATTKVFSPVRVPSAPFTPIHIESERQFFTSTPGHNNDLINHKVVRLPETIKSTQAAFEYNLDHHALAGHVFTTDAGPGILKLWHIEKTGGVDVPYWDVEVDPEIIKDHGDIWNPRALAMMAGIFRMNLPGPESAKAAVGEVGSAGVAAKLSAPAVPPKPNLRVKPDYEMLKIPQASPAQ